MDIARHRTTSHDIARHRTTSHDIARTNERTNEQGRVSSHDDFSAEIENAAILRISRTRPRIFAPGGPSYLNPKLNDANIR